MNSVDQELIVAAVFDSLPEVSRLLRAGADVNVKGDLDKTPLHQASANGNLPVVNELLEHGADVNAKDVDGDTPLHYACWNGHSAVIIELLCQGADMEAKGYDGQTPLHYASCNGHVAIVQELVSRGANILAASDAGRLPIHEAVTNRHSVVSKYLLQQLYATTRRLPLHELLEDLAWIGNPDIGVAAPPLRTALRHNVLGTDDVVEILESLVERDPALVSSRDQDGTLPLHIACRRGASFAIVQSLVNLYKVSVKNVTSEGDLPLFLACERPEPSLDTIFLLMKLYPDFVYR
jgi:ankyrin repeat protein